jgi:hypothetical protein
MSVYCKLMLAIGGKIKHFNNAANLFVTYKDCVAISVNTFAIMKNTAWVTNNVTLLSMNDCMITTKELQI